MSNNEKKYIPNLVSIVLLCYKNAEFIDEAIESILKKTYQNFEVIVADDASNVGRKEIIERWAEKDSRIIPLIHEKNLSMSGKGLKKHDPESTVISKLNVAKSIYRSQEDWYLVPKNRKQP